MKKILVFLIMSLFLAYGCKYFKKRTASKEDTLIADTTQRNNLVSDTNSVVPQPADPISNEESSAPGASGKYFMIVGCFSVPQNAENYAAKLKNMGYNPQVLPGAGGFKMVSAKSYDSWRQIVAELDKFRSEVEPGAWVYAAK